eukprot:TRINITY_DN1292_c0_g1_i1.p1 TRINITY_DN1292_c0_g1~~TRINITY_DN1292_c0_g1_i1.p1  ORF type:complete len:530 (+),score=101.89 TRINITY_DN1292_c0_g1_i1:694-2283(+)
MAFRGADGKIFLTIGADVYMLFAPDLKDFYAGLEARLPREIYAQLHVLVSATHNHEGPDTSGLSGINRDWYAYFLNRMVETAMQAIERMEEVTLTVADADWMFGLGDRRDPRIVDPRLTVVQARAVADRNRVVGTFVQWGMHPEVTLGYGPKVPDAECAALGEAPGCSANGKYLTADFPGYLYEYLSAQTNRAPVVYINGAIGAQIGPHGPVWEVSERYPIVGDGSQVPDGATLVPKNFRKALLIGRELAYAVVRTLQGPRAASIPFGELQIRTEESFTYLTNLLFRAGMAPSYRDPTQPLLIGYEMRDLYNCQKGVQPSPETCVHDEFQTVPFPNYDLPVRKGDYAKVRVDVIKMGPVTFFSIPGEIAPEVVNGVPADFDDAASVSKYYQNPTQHAIGSNYTIPGVMKDMLACDYCIPMGLTQDEGGYIVPISDWWISCFGSSACKPEGYITGEECKYIVENDISEGYYACLTGQVSQYSTHYEEILSLGWDAAEDVVEILGRLLGVPASGRYTRDDWTRPRTTKRSD